MGGFNEKINFKWWIFQFDFLSGYWMDSIAIAGEICVVCFFGAWILDTIREVLFSSTGHQPTQVHNLSDLTISNGFVDGKKSLCSSLGRSARSAPLG